MRVEEGVSRNLEFLGSIIPGSAVINEEHNLCIVCDPTTLTNEGCLVELATGRVYTVPLISQYEVVKATAIWNHIV